MTDQQVLIFEQGNAGHEFTSEWYRLARKGWCDEYGASEYYRVLREWIEADLPRPIEPFIRWRANVGPNPNGKTIIA